MGQGGSQGFKIPDQGTPYLIWIARNELVSTNLLFMEICAIIILLGKDGA
jgi:hypothetical protein